MGLAAFRLYWEAEKLPFIGLPDPDHAAAQRYKQQVKVFKLGRMPLVCVVDATRPDPLCTLWYFHVRYSSKQDIARSNR